MADERRQQTRDIVVIGASAGGLEPLRDLISALPGDFPAAVFVVMHMGGTSHLAHILSQAAALPVTRAENGDAVRQRHVYVASPGRHLLVHDGHLLLRRGPRENMSRPAIDPLFRSAAASFTTRVIAVLLSGALNDGTAGMLAVKRCGGIAVVQDPDDAAVSSMPVSALRHVEVDHVVPSAAMAALLRRLAAEPAPHPVEAPLQVRLEAAIAAQELAEMIDENKLGNVAPFSCPECHGTLWEIDDPGMLRFRCRVGHAYSADAVLSAKGEEVDTLLWSLLRTNEERASLARRAAAAERRDTHHNLAEKFEERAREYERDAELVRRLLRDHNVGSDPGRVTDPPGPGASDAEQ